MDQQYVLPQELWCEIFSLLGDVADILRIQLVSRIWRDQVWRSIQWLNLSPMKQPVNGYIMSYILTRTQSLRKLDLTGCELSEICLGALQIVPNLTSLILTSCNAVSYGDLHHISSLSRLEELDCNELFRSSIERFAAEPFLLRKLEPQQGTLNTLKLSGALLRRMESITTFSNLTALDLHGCPFLNEDYRPYLPLQKLTSLRALNIGDMSARGISNGELRQLSIHLTNLRRLGAAKPNSNLSIKGFANMSCLQQLEWLNMADIQPIATDELMAHLRPCTNLKTLELSCEDHQVKAIQLSFVQDVCIIRKDTN